MGCDRIVSPYMQGREFEPRAKHPLPGSADLCFMTQHPLAKVIYHLAQSGIPLLAGPVQRTGAAGPILSVYFHDPDGNLIEVAN